MFWTPIFMGMIEKIAIAALPMVSCNDLPPPHPDPLPPGEREELVGKPL